MYCTVAHKAMTVLCRHSQACWPDSLSVRHKRLTRLLLLHTSAANHGRSASAEQHLQQCMQRTNMSTQRNLTRTLASAAAVAIDASNEHGAAPMPAKHCKADCIDYSVTGQLQKGCLVMQECSLPGLQLAHLYTPVHSVPVHSCTHRTCTLLCTSRQTAAAATATPPQLASAPRLLPQPLQTPPQTLHGAAHPLRLHSSALLSYPLLHQPSLAQLQKPRHAELQGVCPG